MINTQILISIILGGALLLFLWGRWRHDVVAFLALIVAVGFGVVEIDEAFSGFSHPAVITVATVLVISRALQLSGVIDIAAKHIAGIADNPLAYLTLLTIVGAVLSAFMNNVGALALMMPLAMRTARSPSQILMPLSFGTILGGMMTEIGTPPNIIIAAYREEASGQAFGLFDFSPVGVPLAFVGLAFLVVFGWRLIPKGRRGGKTLGEIREGAKYITEAQVDKGARAIGKTIRQLERMVDNEAMVIGVIRHGFRRLGRVRDITLEENDIVILRTQSTAFHKILEDADMSLIGDSKADEDTQPLDDITLLEFVVMPGARIDWRSARELKLSSRYGVNMLAVARQGETIEQRLGHIQLRAGDVLLMQGDKETLQETMSMLGCIPLAERGLQPIRRRKRFLPFVIFAAAIAATSLGLMPVQISFSAAVIALVLFELISPREIYDSIDWPVIVLLGSFIPLGAALESTGVTDVLAQWVVGVSGHVSVWGILTMVMILTMALTNLINNAATAVMMAPIAVQIATQINVNSDPFLMATAIAASSAFLTPIGHQNNVLVMGPGGYRFGDYWRMGLPLQILIVALGVPLILLVWPL